MKRFPSCFLKIFLLISIQFVSFSFLDAMELIEVAAERGLGKAGAAGLEEGALRAVGEELAEKMGFVEAESGLKAINELPEKTKAAFQEELTKAFQKYGENIFKEGKFAPAQFDPFISELKTNFRSQLSSLGEQRGFSSFEKEAINKFELPDIDLEKFPIKTEREVQIFETNKSANFSERELSPVEQELNPIEREVTEAQRNLDYAQSIENPEKITQAKDSLESATKNLTEKRQSLLKELSGEEAEKLNRRSALREFKDAEERRVSSKERINKAEKELAEARKTGNEEEIEAREKALEKAREENRIAGEDYDQAKRKMIDAGQASFGTRAADYAKKFAKTLGEQLLVGFIGGFAFSLPNFVIGAIEQAMGAKSQRLTLLTPQRFGNIWMQIPKDLVSDPDEPTSAKFLYIGLEKDPQSDNVKRDDTADTESYLEKANYFVARTEYDDYAQSPITDPRFPGRMVHLNTGFQFIDNLKEVPGQAIVQFLGEPPKEFRQNLQFHLNDQSGQIRRGVTGAEYFEYRKESTGYKGSPAIADRLDEKTNMDIVRQQYPELAKEKQGYGAVLNSSMQVFKSGQQLFNAFNVHAFEALDEESIKKIGGSNPPEKKPYVAFGIFVYQTADTPNIKTARNILTQDPEQVALVEKVIDYVLVLDEDGAIIPLQKPAGSGQWNFPSYTVNPKIHRMVSLLDGISYKEGKVEPSNIDVGKLIANYFPQGKAQIDAMKQFIADQIKYGPFTAGDIKLTIDKQLSDDGVFIYKNAQGLENGGDDYVVATQGMQVISLPAAATNFVSLVTSRIYDNNFVPYNKEHAGKKNIPFTIYKIADEAPPVVVAGPTQTKKYGTPISQGLNAPLFSLFMDPDINPNQIDEKSIPKPADQQWLAKKVGALKNGAIQWPLPIPVPNQWALSDRGPVLAAAEKQEGQRISDLLTERAPELLKTINKIHAEWKIYYEKLDPQEIERQLGIFPWATFGLRTINMRATSEADVKNGNFVYSSPFYPDEYLVMSRDQEGSQGFATQYDFAEPQRYVISISSGKVYDAQKEGEMVSRITNLDELLKKVTNIQGKFLPTLLNKIKNAQTIHKKTLEQEQYGPRTAFGAFQFYLFKEDLLRGQYIYADVSNIADPLSLDEKALMDKIQNFFIAINLKEGIKPAPGSPDDPSLNPTNWVYGDSISEKTIRVLSLVNGTLYDRGGTYQGYFKEFAESVDKNIDVQKGFIDLILGYLKATWQQEKKPLQLRPELQQKIVALTQKEYKKLLAEKAEIQEAIKKEEQLFQPLDRNIIANIDAQSYLDSLQSLIPPRYIKKYQAKYYSVSPDPRVYIDFNVGEAGKDNRMGMSYDSTGNALVLLTGWVLDNARAYAGIEVTADGKQELNVAVDHPQIPIENMVKLDPASLQKGLQTAREAFRQAVQTANKNPQNKQVRQQLVEAAAQYGYAKQAYDSAQYAAKVEQPKGYKIAFYFNKDIAAYFVAIESNNKVSKYIDLIAGYQYNADGTPRLFEKPLLVNVDATKNDKLFLGEDAQDLLTAQYKGTRDEYYTWVLAEETEDAVRGKNYMKYSMINSLGDELFIYHDKPKNEYKIFTQSIDQDEPEQTGMYKPDSTLKYSLLRYFRTIAKGAKAGIFVQDDYDELNPSFIVWNGESDLKLENLYYKSAYITLKSAGADSYSGEYEDSIGKHTITVEKKTIKHGQTVTGHYLTITDGNKTFEFVYDYSLLDPELPVTCIAEDELERLNHWKQCIWQINVSVDSAGISRLVSSLPTRMPHPSGEDVARVLEQAGDRKNIVSNNIKLLWHDTQNNRYLYKFTERDAGWAYYNPKWQNWYVDLRTGIIYNSSAAGPGAYPIGALHASQLYILLDRLEVSVGNVPASDGQLIFDASGNPITSPDGTPYRVKPGLVYRGSSVINQEIKQHAARINQLQQK